jgi:tetraacyldisaccharide 4'-kinase
VADWPRYWNDLIRQQRFRPESLVLLPLLRVGSWGYALGSYLRNRAFDSGKRPIHRVNVPVISVGNLSLGGTGKTPCVEAVARILSDEGWQVAILSRGYGQTSGPNDEAMLLETNLPDVPHLQGIDRVELARTAIEELQSDVLVLDDGFQHRRLHRDLDIVLIDATDPWGPGAIFPRGTLRESKKSLGRAGLIVLTRVDQVPSSTKTKMIEEIRKWNSECEILEASHRPHSLIQETGETHPPEWLQNKRILAFSGIGNPKSFEKTLTNLGAVIVETRHFQDHHPYDRNDVESLTNWANQHYVDAVVTTQKDAVKLRIDSFADKPLYALKIEFAVPETFAPLIRSVMTGYEPKSYDEEYPEAFLPQE